MSSRSARSTVWTLASMLLISLGAGCGRVEALFNSARITDITPGQSLSGGDLDCWLTLEFDEAPGGIDPSDVRVRFESVALLEASDFDWSYIAGNDVVSAGTQFGSGYSPNSQTAAESPPPAGMPIKVRFKLKPKQKLENPPDPLYLQAHLYWGGEHEDSTRRTIEHVYASSPDSFF
jgi:hypothetical protein